MEGTQADQENTDSGSRNARGRGQKKPAPPEGSAGLWRCDVRLVCSGLAAAGAGDLDAVLALIVVQAVVVDAEEELPGGGHRH